jgi:hypothetical protein
MGAIVTQTGVKPTPSVPSVFIFRVAVAFLWLLAFDASACIWDADTKISERFKNPKMADAILHDPPQPSDPAPLLKRIEELQATPRKADPAWWNDLAGRICGWAGRARRWIY